MKIYQSLILGILQGITEFLPISSSGHLVLLPSLFGWKIQSLAFDTVLHLGTATALIAYFRNDILEVIKSEKLLKLILAASVPAVILGYILEKTIANNLRSASHVAIFLLIGSVIMLIAEKTYKNIWHEERLDNPIKLTYAKGVLIGLFQSLALFPGVSRSGATISGGIFSGLSRETSARFSFILSIPIVLGAGLYKMTKSYKVLSFDVALMAGFLASSITGFLVIKWLLKFLKKNTLTPFVVYRLLLAGAIFILLI